MKVSLNWIKDYVDLPRDMDLTRLAYDLTMSTVEVEGATDLARQFDHMLVGQITEVCPHPNADKLQICRTDIGGGDIRDIVCGGALHPEGGGLRGQALYRRPDIPGAALRVLHGDGEAVGPGAAGEGGQGLERQVIQSRQLPGDAVMAPQVGPVGHGFVVDLQDDVVEVQGVGNGGPRRGVKGAQVQDVGLLGGGEQVPQADLHRAADHAVAFDAPELGLLDLHRLALTVPAAHGAGAGHGDLHSVAQVHAAADDLADVAAADVGPADLQLDFH